MSLLVRASHLLRPVGARSMTMEIFRGTGERSGECIRAKIETFHGRVYVDVRKFFKPEDGTNTGTDEFLPTKKGISMSVEQFEAFTKSIDKIRREMDTI